MVKKIKVIIAVFCTLLCFASCSGKAYGNEFKTLEKLQASMKSNSVDLLYPQGFESQEKADYNYVVSRDYESENINGYKIYRFGSPFYVGVYGYKGTSNELVNDSDERTEKIETIKSDVGEIAVHSGKGYEDALFLIGSVNIDGNHYECRVTADKEMQDVKYKNAIYENNENYDKAIKEIVETLNGLK